MSDVLANTTEEVLVSNLADELNFVETDAEVINADLISRFEEYLGLTLAKGDERRIFLQGFSYAFADALNHINETGRSNLLRYAIGNELDALGTDIFHNSRLTSRYATTTLKFTISESQSQKIVVPKGTRVTPDGVIFFATDEEIVFEPKTPNHSQEVAATATEAGSSHNDYAVGSINILVDTIAYISGVSNVTVSNGGSDVETDAEYRERLRESPFSFSVAGPANAYKAIAKGVSADIADVAVYSPSAGVVEIAVVKDGGEIPEQDDAILSQILSACSAKDVRPLTDKVQVVPASNVDINIVATYYVANGNTAVRAAVEEAATAFKAWQTEKIGRDINPDKLRTLMFEAGAARVEITEPSYQSLAENEIAQIKNISLTYGGSITV